MTSNKLSFFLLTSPFLLLASEPPSKGPATKVNFPANFQVEEGIDLFVYGDYLYWVAKEEGLNLVQKGNVASGSIQKIDPKFTSAFRVGLGLNFPRAGYDIGAYWTLFSQDTKSSTNTTSWPLWGEPNLSPLSSETASWKLKLNVVDLEWGRDSWFGGNFSLRPFFSLQGAQVDQHLLMNPIYETSPVSRGEIFAKSDFFGGGLRAGCNGRWTFPYGFALYGKAAGSLLYGKFETKSTWDLEDVLVASNANNFLHTLSSMNLALGIAWDTHFAKDRLHIEFHVGWEATLFFHMNRMGHYVGALTKGLFFEEGGNLSLQGVTVGGRFDF